jgi:flagellar basal-body rod modification protein FlgD
MMEITPTTGAAPVSGSDGPSATNGDFETFLRMLTTQIQNQDPLSPMDSDQFADQLATFTMVEQQTLTNQRLESLIDALSYEGLADYSNLMGRTAVHDGPFEFSGAPIALEIGGTDGASDDASLVILDEQGSVVSEQIVPAGQSRVSWDGTGMDGQVLTPGSYRAELRDGATGEVVEIPVLSASEVEEVLFGATEVALRLADGSVVPESAVSRLR